MKSKIVKIGNSQGIRIPKLLIEETGIDNEVEITVSGNTLVISSASSPRAGWDVAFDQMTKNRDDAFLDSDAVHLSSWDQEEWTW